jgi:hypothetical protein
MITNANNDFERRIKSSLEGFEASYTPGDWEDLDVKLNTLPKHTPSFNFDFKKFNFKWKFSANIYIALLACAAFFLIMYKLGGVSGSSKASTVNDVAKNTPVVNASEIKTPLANVPVKASPLPQVALTMKDSASYEEPAGPELSSADAVAGNKLNDNSGNASQSKTTEKDKPAVVAEQTTASQAGPETPKVVVFGDMIDPKHGLMYNTKEKVSTTPTQTKVNVGWNDYVIYDPAKSKATDTTKAAMVPAIESGSTAEKKKSGRKKKGLDKAISSESPGTTPGAQTIETTGNSNFLNPAESSDSTRKAKVKNPKLKSEVTPDDPY